MQTLELVPLIASSLTTVAPATQIYHIFKTKSVAGLSTLTSVALVTASLLSLLIGVQYQLGSVIILMVLTLLLQGAMLFMVSRRAFLLLTAVDAIVIAIIWGLFPAFAADLTTTRYAEQVGFIWGLLAAGTFVPQVLLTRKTRMTGDLSLATLLCFAVGMTLWVCFAILVRNWSLTLWTGILTLSIYELLRLKLTVRPPSA